VVSVYGCIPVGAHDQDGNLGVGIVGGQYSGSNTGPSVDIFAPGGSQDIEDRKSLPSTPTPSVVIDIPDLTSNLGIPVTDCAIYPYCVNIPEPYAGYPRKREFYANATSIATPYVAGTVALMKQIRRSITLNEAMSIIRNTARASTDPWIYPYGGLINSEAVVRSMGAN
jgi:subtilisin family serine protease